MRTLQRLGNPMEAEILRARLDSAGIRAVVNGGEVGTMLSHIGTAAVSIRVEVAPEDYERAEEILREDELERSERQAWICSRCDERNEPLFDMCWSCSKKRSESDQEAPNDAPNTIRIHESGPIVVEPPAERLPPSDNPYAPSSTLDRDAPAVIKFDSLEPDERTIETVTRIFRGAVIGTIVLPPLVTLYVICSLLFVVPKSAYRSPKLRWRLWASWALCVPAILFAVLIWTSFLAMF